MGIAQFAYDRGFHMMTHVGDPRAWFFGKGVYADGSFGTFEGQFAMLERMLERYPDRIHMGGPHGRVFGGPGTAGANGWRSIRIMCWT